MKAWICIVLVSMNKWSWIREKLLRGNQEEKSQSYPSFQLWYLKWAPININIITNTKKMLMLKLQYFGQLIRRTDWLEKTLMLGKTESRKRRGWQRTRWFDGNTDSMDMSLSKSGRWWRTRKPSILQSMGSQRVRQNWATEQQYFTITKLWNIYLNSEDGEMGWDRKMRGQLKLPNLVMIK